MAARDARGPLLDLQRVSWAIVLSEISYAEATIKEWLDALKVNCARQGIDFLDPSSKRRKNRTAPGHAVAALILSELAITVLVPKQALHQLLGS